ncbi:hypothetical protein ANN_06875 [Periplaneta americana]|uniref:Uncharacterized protein n=1 Tax=Periplaneta americana TaxID=6978 RepID=A0ABQ8TEP5_PERAM|nr:hypothetical protein ANN_06875 [Periplaneta americana]
MPKQRWTIIQPEFRYRVVSTIPPAIIAGIRNQISLPIVAPQVHHDAGRLGGWVAQLVEQLATDWKVQGLIPDGDRIFSRCQTFRTVPRFTQPPIKLSTRSFLEVKGGQNMVLTTSPHSSAKHAVFSDKCLFFLDGHTHTQNARYWPKEYPRWMCEANNPGALKSYDVVWNTSNLDGGVLAVISRRFSFWHLIGPRGPIRYEAIGPRRTNQMPEGEPTTYNSKYTPPPSRLLYIYMRSLYKDFVWLLNRNSLIAKDALKRKLETTFLGDSLVKCTELHKGRDFEEVRRYQEGKGLVIALERVRKRVAAAVEKSVRRVRLLESSRPWSSHWRGSVDKDVCLLV